MHKICNPYTMSGNHLKILYLSLILSVLHIHHVRAQETWDWKKCIDYALENNLQLKQSDLNIDLQQVNLKQYKYNFTPNISASTNYNIRFGNNYDFYTSQYKKQAINYQDYSLNIVQPVFDGLAYKHNIEKTNIDIQTLKLDEEVLKTNIQLQILIAFLNIMNAQEQLTQAQNQYAQTQEQYQQVKDMIEAGTSAEKNLVDVEAQLTNEDLAISQVNNQLMLAYLNLKQIMQLDLSKDIKIKTPKLPDDIMIAAPAALGNIYQAALGIRPEIKSAELKIESSKKAVDIAKTAYYPSLKFVSNINTFMSTQNKNTQQYLTGNTTAVGFVEGTFQRVLIPESGYKQSKIPYFKQLNQNLNYALGLSLDIPIFSQYRVQTSIKQAQIQTQVASFQKQMEEQTLYNTIAQAYLKTLASIDNYHAAKKNFETAQKSYEYAMERWDAGMINLLETNIAKTNLLNAESKFIQTKYEYLFNSKVLDFYQGKKIEL